VTISEGVTSIGKGTFGGCSKLNSMVIPEGVASIGRGAFDKNITIHAPAGSYAETYAKENNIPFVAE
jgi:hypothetical protein